MVSKRMAETLKGYDANTQRKILRFVEIAGEDYALEHLPVVFKQARAKELELDQMQVSYKNLDLDVAKYLSGSSSYADWIYEFFKKNPTDNGVKYPPQKKLPADKPSGSSGAGNVQMDGIYKQLASDYSKVDPAKVEFFKWYPREAVYPWINKPTPKPPAKKQLPYETPSGSDAGDAVLEFLKSFLRR